jgi:GT2 family glycosyltransferase
LKGDVRPFNSAALLRVAALQKTGGYDRRFWLNYLDHSVFHALQQAGYLVWIAGDLQVKHHLSLHEGRDRMTEEHFHHFSGAESAFRDLYASRFEGLVFTVRLLLRALNQKRRRDPQHFLRTTMAILKGRLFVSRKERIRRWEMEVASMAGEPRIAVQLRGPSAAMPIPVPAGE